MLWTRRIGRLAVEALPVAAVALVISFLLRAHVMEWYLVPSASMEPTLHGDPERGDIVLVDKTAFWFRPPRRFEMVVLRNPDDASESQLVKRMVALGDDDACVRIDEGDVFVGDDRQHLHRVVKDPLRARDMRLTNFAFPGPTPVDRYLWPDPAWHVEPRDGDVALQMAPAAATLEGLRDRLQDDPLRQRRRHVDLHVPGHLSPQRMVDTTFVEANGEQHGAAETYRDFGMEVTVAPSAGCVGVQMVYEWGDRYLAFDYGVDGQVTFVVQGQPSAGDAGGDVQLGSESPSPVRSARGPALPVGHASHLSFGYLDGWLFLIVEGELVWHAPWPLPPDAEDDFTQRGLGGLVHFGVAGGAATVTALRVFHDVYYRALRGPSRSPCIDVPPGTMFLLGDNTFASRDSRTGRMFPVANLIGRPLAVIGPPARTRWLIP